MRPAQQAKHLFCNHPAATAQESGKPDNFIFKTANDSHLMKLKTLIIAAISVILMAAIGLFSVAYYSYTKSEANNGLARACEMGNGPAAAYWLAKGADIEHANKYGETPLILCAHLPWETIETLLLLGANPNTVDIDGRSAIFRAGNATSADTLVRYGADVNLRDKEGLTALEHHQKHRYYMDDKLKAVLEGKGPAAKMLEESRSMIEKLEKERQSVEKK